MEDKNIIINGEKINFFNFFNVNQQLTELKYFNPARLVFTEPVTRKLQNNITFRRVYIGILGPKPKTVSDKIKHVYDVNELLDYDAQNGEEFQKKYDFSKIEDEHIHILINTDWYANNIDSVKEKSFVYGINDKLYHDEVKHKEVVFKQFTVFDATALYKQKPTMLNKIPSDKYSILLSEKWVKNNLSDKYLKGMDKVRPFVFPSEEAFSFGVTRNTLDVNGISYQISLCLYDRENPKDDEIKWAAKYEEITAHCREHLKNNPDEFKKIKNMVDTMKGLSWKGGEVGDSDGPKLYPKIMFNQKKEEFITVFMDENDDIVEDPKNILDKRCKVKVALRFESIFIGSKVIALQVRVNDVAVSKWIESYKPKALILRKGENTNNTPPKSKSKHDDKSDESDLNSSSSEEEEEEEEKPKRVIKTVKV